MSRRDVAAQRWLCDWNGCEDDGPVLASPVHPEGWLRLVVDGERDFCSSEHLILWLNTRTLGAGGHLSDLLHIEVGVG